MAGPNKSQNKKAILVLIASRSLPYNLFRLEGVLDLGTIPGYISLNLKDNIEGRDYPRFHYARVELWDNTYPPPPTFFQN